MKNITDLLPTSRGRLKQHEKPQGERISDNGAMFISKLFAELKVIFPAWKAAFPTDEEEALARQIWSKGLIENNCASRQHLSRGMAKARLHDKPFLPSIGMFIKWCEADGADLGLPTEREAFNQAIGNGGEKHPATLYALNLIDSHELRSTNTERAQKIWREAWQDTVRHVETGGALPLPIPRENRLERAPMEQEKAIENVNRLKDLLGGL